MSNPPPGPLLRLRGLSRSQLPPLPANPTTLTPFLTALLSEALPFIDSVSPKFSPPNNPPSSPWKVKSTKHLPHSSSPITLLTRVVPASALLPPTSTSTTHPPRQEEEVKPETWACRLSLHPDAARQGTASWSEFRHAIKERHAETEEAFTPTVISAREVVRWDCDGVGGLQIEGERWGKFTLAVQEVRHNVGRPVLKDRVFGVVQMTGCLLDTEGGGEGGEFVVVSVPVRDFGMVPGEEPGKSSTKKKGEVVVGRYVSVERVRKLEAGEGGGDGQEGKIEWLMATASDAGGVLPAWVQARAVPGQIAKDVGLFLGWMKEERKKRDWDGETVVGKKEKMETSVAREQAALRRQTGWGSAGAGLT